MSADNFKGSKPQGASKGNGKSGLSIIPGVEIRNAQKDNFQMEEARIAQGASKGKAAGR